MMGGVVENERESAAKSVVLEQFRTPNPISHFGPKPRHDMARTSLFMFTFPKLRKRNKKTLNENNRLNLFVINHDHTILFFSIVKIIIQYNNYNTIVYIIYKS